MQVSAYWKDLLIIKIYIELPTCRSLHTLVSQMKWINLECSLDLKISFLTYFNTQKTQDFMYKLAKINM